MTMLRGDTKGCAERPWLGTGEFPHRRWEGAPHVVDTIKTKVGAKTAALDTDTGRIYLPTADFGPINAKTGKPTILPDTFSVIVVGR
ncbi:hypothetical protein [Asticcacaulis benevestitus]|nr:hypothetical protein [Asticcacaulis benevestitus]